MKVLYNIYTLTTTIEDFDMFKLWTNQMVVDHYENKMETQTPVASAIHEVCALSGHKRLDVINILRKAGSLPA